MRLVRAANVVSARCSKFNFFRDVFGSYATVDNDFNRVCRSAIRTVMAVSVELNNVTTPFE